MSKKTVGALAVALFAAAPGWAINKCTRADGKVVFQDAPCVGEGEEVVVRPATGAGPSSPQDARFANAMATGKVMLGMSAAQVRRAWGEPIKVNTTIGSSGRNEQWVYDRENAQTYVHLENGVVSRIQSFEPTRAAQTAPQPAPRTRSCPTPHEIRGLETSASSVTISNWQRRKLQEQIKDARDCLKQAS